MCFSAFVSFAASTLLVPAGLYCIKTALHKHAYLPFACMPLAFGIQQGFEGIVWLGIHSNNLTTIHTGALGFLFFSHWFWLFWIPLIVLQLEHDQKVQRICQLLAIIGALYGAFLYLPLLIHDHWLSATAIHHSIEYQAKFIGDAVPILFSRLLYILIILTPLIISSNSYIKVFGILITFSTVISYSMFNYAFVSVWCFFAALLSLYVSYIISKASTLPPGVKRGTIS